MTAGDGAATESAEAKRATRATARAGASGGLILATLAVAEFLMVLDSSVMNVSIAYVSKDVHTTVTGVQMAITMYALVMAALMITGGKIGAMIGRRRAFALGCVTYGIGAGVTALAHNLAVLMIGWSLIEGMGAALIMPTAVALVAANFTPERRPAAYGLLTAASAMAIAAGPLIGGAVTTFASWRWVFGGEFIIVFVILALTRKMSDTAPAGHQHLDVPGMVLSIVGLAAIVFGVLKTSEWGWVTKAGAPQLLGLSPSLWLILGGLIVCFAFVLWERRVERVGGEPLVRLSMLRNHQLTGGLLINFFQYLVQGGVGFVVPLFLSIVLGLTALATGLWLFPLSVALLASAIVVPKAWPAAWPRLVVRVGLLLFFAGVLLLMVGIQPGVGAWVVAAPLALMGLGAGCMASQIGAVIVSSVPDDQSPEVGGLQNTVVNLGSSMATALTGSVLIATLSASFLAGIVQSPKVPASVKQKAEIELAAGIPFVSNAQLRGYMETAKATPAETQFVINDNAHARVKGLQTALALVALLCIVALFFTGKLPRSALGGEEEREAEADAGGEPAAALLATRPAAAASAASAATGASPGAAPAAVVPDAVASPAPGA